MLAAFLGASTTGLVGVGVATLVAGALVIAQMTCERRMFVASATGR